MSDLIFISRKVKEGIAAQGRLEEFRAAFAGPMAEVEVLRGIGKYEDEDAREAVGKDVRAFVAACREAESEGGPLHAAEQVRGLDHPVNWHTIAADILG